MNDPIAKCVIDDLSGLISNRLRKLDSEERFPGNNADESDDLIKELKTEVTQLRTLREQLEVILFKCR